MCGAMRLPAGVPGPHPFLQIDHGNQIALRSKVSDNKNDAPTMGASTPSCVGSTCSFRYIARNPSDRHARAAKERHPPVQWPGAAAAARIRMSLLCSNCRETRPLPCGPGDHLARVTAAQSSCSYYRGFVFHESSSQVSSTIKRRTASFFSSLSRI